MKLFSFPSVMLEKAINKRLLTLDSEAKDWFGPRWALKPYKKSFLSDKAMPLVTLLAKGKTCSEEDFNELLAEWEGKFHPAEVAVLRPLIDGDGLIQLMQKNMPADRLQILRDRLVAQGQDLPPSDAPAA
jgi:hypothetical protein